MKILNVGKWNEFIVVLAFGSFGRSQSGGSIGDGRQAESLIILAVTALDHPL